MLDPRQRYVLAVWLLLASVVLATGGWLAWSHVDSHHRVTGSATTVCVAPAQEHSAVPNSVEAASSAGMHRYTITFRSRQPGDICTGGDSRVLASYVSPNHVPGALLVALAGLAGTVGIVLLRRHSDAAPAV